MVAYGVCSLAMTFGGSVDLPSNRPSFMNAMTNRERSPTFEKMDPAGHDAALFAAGRTTIGRPLVTSCPCANGYVIARSGRRVVRVMPRGLKTLSAIWSAYF